MAPSVDPEHDDTPTSIEGVVVGFDGSMASQLALEWAADAAFAHRLPLTLLSAQPDAEGEVLDLEEAEEAGLWDDEVVETLDDAVERVERQYPQLEVTGIIHPESPVDGILDASKTADMVVLGSRGMGGFQGLLLGSTTMNVAPHADCPVVVLYEPDEATVAAVATARHPDEIVVGFDGSPYAERALEFALAHAQATGLGVAVVVVTKNRREVAPEPVAIDADGLPAAAGEQLLAAAGIASTFPDVPVTYLHGQGRPAGVLIREAAGAALAVVGVRGRGGFSGLLLGSVGLQMLIHAECPVAIVREAHASLGE